MACAVTFSTGCSLAAVDVFLLTSNSRPRTKKRPRTNAAIMSSHRRRPMTRSMVAASTRTAAATPDSTSSDDDSVSTSSDDNFNTTPQPPPPAAAPATTLPHEQATRLERMYREPLYLMDIGSDNKFTMTGSTGNLYTVTINAAATSATALAPCTCPDAKMHARRAGVVCKHGCFVLLKVLRLPQKTLYTFPVDESAISTALETCRSRHWGHLTDAEYQMRYAAYLAQQQQSSLPFSSSASSSSSSASSSSAIMSPFAVSEDAAIDDACAICLDAMVPVECARCPGCRNYFHTNCISIWLAVGGVNRAQKKCPLCRSSWAGYETPEQQQQAKKKKQRPTSSSLSGFINLQNHFC